MRRSKTDMRLGRWVVRQIHRQDCQVELQHDSGRRVCISFTRLRDEYRWVAAAPERVA